VVVGRVADDHELSHRARAYGEQVVRGTEWPLDGVDLATITWATSTRAKRRHGRCSYDGGGRATITLTEHTYDRAGFDACKKTIRHELVHAWQYQHRGEQAVVTESGVDLRTAGAAMASSHSHDDHTDTATATSVETSTTIPDSDAGFTIQTGHGDSFRAWVDPLELPGRCSTYYDRRKADFAYIYGCPNCEQWWGKHRLCKSVRQAAHGGEGSTGYRYCTNCEVLLHLQQGDWYLDHADHDDDTIRAFVAGEFESAVDSELPLVHTDEITAADRPE
jgi:predicted SprT family Zn-dependent metalloprotease